jgi:sigma-E factor negative regulatory protein RseC
VQEIGIVKHIDGIFAKVIIGRKNSCCESCEKESCDIPENGIETEAINAVGASIGQKVKIVMRSHTYIKGALVVYALPVFALIAGAIFGKIYFPVFFKNTDSDLMAAGGGFLALLLSLVLVKFLAGRIEGKTENKSVIEEIIN